MSSAIELLKIWIIARCVTEQQFRRSFPFVDQFTEPEMDILIDKYTDKERSALNGVNYLTMHHDVMDRVEAPPAPPFPRSDLVIRPDNSTWSAQDYTPEEKVMLDSERVVFFE